MTCIQFTFASTSTVRATIPNPSLKEPSLTATHLPQRQHQQLTCHHQTHRLVLSPNWHGQALGPGMTQRLVRNQRPHWPCGLSTKPVISVFPQLPTEEQWVMEQWFMLPLKTLLLSNEVVNAAMTGAVPKFGQKGGGT